MKLVVDASVALKWVIEEDDSDAAGRLLDEVLLAPDLLPVECANVLWVKARRGDIRREDAAAALLAIRAAPIQFLVSTDYVEAAQQITFELGHTVYDSLYLAVARDRDALLVTADQKFANAAARHRGYRSAVRLLQ